MTTIDDALGTRHATLQDLAVLLRGQKARKIDVIAPACSIRARGGLIVLDDTVPDLTPDGVGMTAGTYRPTSVCDAGIADKLAIPVAYLRRMRERAPAFYDQNVNTWLEQDDRSFLVRCLRPDTPGPGATGIARAGCPTGTRSSTTSTSWSPPSMASGRPGTRSRSRSAT